MKTLVLVVVSTWVTAVSGLAFACGGALAAVQLQPGGAPSTLRLGQTAAIQVPSDRHYSIGFAGVALAPVKQMRRHDTTIYIYRAVEVGNQTFVLTPRDPGPDGCISCVTEHYYVKVIQ